MQNIITERIIAKVGGHQRVAEILGLDVSRIYRWTYPKNKGGTDGIIPARHQIALLRFAEAEKIDLQPNDFYNLPTRDDPPMRSGSNEG